MNIAKERKRMNLSVEKLADLVGVHPNTVRGWERGEHEPTGKNIVQLSALFGCSPDYLIGMTDKRVPR